MEFRISEAQRDMVAAVRALAQTEFHRDAALALPYRGRERRRRFARQSHADGHDHLHRLGHGRAATSHNPARDFNAVRLNGI